MSRAWRRQRMSLWLPSRLDTDWAVCLYTSTTNDWLIDWLIDCVLRCIGNITVILWRLHNIRNEEMKWTLTARILLIYYYRNFKNARLWNENVIHVIHVVILRNSKTRFVLLELKVLEEKIKIWPWNVSRTRLTMILDSQESFVCLSKQKTTEVTFTFNFRVLEFHGF